MPEIGKDLATAAPTVAGPTPGWRSRLERHAESLLIALLTLFYLFSFRPDSWVSGGPQHNDEIFGQDSLWIVQSLAEGKPYPWNAQHHMLYHGLVEGLYNALCAAGIPRGSISAFWFLKFFTALNGAVVLLFHEKAMSSGPRADTTFSPSEDP